MAVGPSAAYLPQYFQIRSSRNHKAFSSVICFILLTANISRLCCFILEDYGYSLFIQSVLMVMVQLVLLHLIVLLCVRDILPTSSKSSSKDDEPSGSSSTLLVAKPSFVASFWAWPSFVEYILFLVAFTVVFLALMSINFAFNRTIIPRILFLYFSTGIESTLCMPQLLTNYRNKSTEGLNKPLVCTWIAGDSYKLFYFFHNESNQAFISCAIIQLAVDFLIVGQIIYYGRFASRPPVSNETGLSRPSSIAPLTAGEKAKASPQLVISNKN